MPIDMWINIGFTVVIGILQSLSAEKQSQFRKVFLKINKLISMNYSGDAEFRNVWSNTIE